MEQLRSENNYQKATIRESFSESEEFERVKRKLRESSRKFETVKKTVKRQFEKVGEGWRKFENVGEGWRKFEKIGEGPRRLEKVRESSRIITWKIIEIQ